MMAAKGLAPMPPGELVKVAYLLMYDADAGVAAAAKATLAGIPDKIVMGVASTALPPQVLDHIARARGPKVPGLVEKVLLNPATHDETFAYLATTCKERELEIIAENQARLLRHPKIIEGLYFNKGTRMSTVDRVIDFAVRNGVIVDGIPAFQEAAEALGVLKTEKGVPATAPIEVALPVETEAPAEVAAASGGYIRLSADDTRSLFDEDEKEEGENTEKVASVTKLLLSMNISQKIRYAQLGNKEVRGKLIRESNRLIASAAVKNPRMTENEIVVLSANKSLIDDVIRYISKNREWTKNYQVRWNLATNPKTPLPFALQFLQTLRDDHLKILAKSKNISNVVQTAARKRVLQKEKYGS